MRSRLDGCGCISGSSCFHLTHTCRSHGRRLRCRKHEIIILLCERERESSRFIRSKESRVFKTVMSVISKQFGWMLSPVFRAVINRH